MHQKIIIAWIIFLFYFRTYQCLRHNAELNLEKLRDLRCTDDNDCGTDISQMICTNYTRSSLTKYCSCPPGYAYNTNECKCMPAEICCTNSVSNYLIIIIVAEFLYSISGIMCKWIVVLKVNKRKSYTFILLLYCIYLDRNSIVKKTFWASDDHWDLAQEN